MIIDLKPVALLGRVIFISVFALSASFVQAEVVVREAAPERYTVLEGDTLWDIASRFLRDPWRWPEVWHGNPQVENPDLIFPGDVLLFSYVDGDPRIRSLRKKTVKLSPTARVEDFRDAIPAIDPAAIQAFINAPLVTSDKELMSAAYIVEGVDNRLLMGKYDQFYARGVDGERGQEYQVFRPGRHFIHPFTKESLGFEAEHVGDAILRKVGDPARLALLDTYSDVSIRDRLRPVYRKSLISFFQPQAPLDKNIRGYLLETPSRNLEIGPLMVIAISIGTREGVRKGDVFRINSQSGPRKDPLNGETYFLPEENVGLCMVFRVFEKISYAIITNSSRQVTVGDAVVSPDID